MIVRGDVDRGCAEAFFREVKGYKGDCPPIFNMDGVTYAYIKKSGLYFMATTRQNVSPSLLLELLARVTKIVKDYAGVLNEESIRKNFVLVYELLDEIMDYGYPQTTTTETLKAYIHNEALLVEAQQTAMGGSGLPFKVSERRTTSSSATSKPIALSYEQSRNRKSEVFLDLLERLTVLFSSNGTMLRAEIDGTIQMKSYLSGNPELRLALNEDLVIGRSGGVSYGVVLDDCNFHECVKLDEFESGRVLSFHAPDGEFEVMKYRVSGEFRAPFRVLPFVDEIGPGRYDVLVKIRADIPQSVYGSNIIVRLPVPKNTSAVTGEINQTAAGQQGWEYKPNDKMVVWNIKKFMGGNEHYIRVKLTLNGGSTASTKREIGPISMEFELPMYSCSTVQIRYLRVVDRSSSFTPSRWVRYITHSSSYVCRVSS